jgi:hypothetical protein
MVDLHVGLQYPPLPAGSTQMLPTSQSLVELQL